MFTRIHPFIFTLISLFMLAGCNEPKAVSGVVEFMSPEKGKLLEGSISVQVFHDRRAVNFATETKIEKPYLDLSSYPFNFDLEEIKKAGVDLERGFFIKAVFNGGEPLKDDPKKSYGPFVKYSFIIGPLKGGEENLILYLD